MSDTSDSGVCPICDKTFPMADLVQHVDACLFLKSDNEQQKRKRENSPTRPKETRFKFKKSPNILKQESPKSRVVPNTNSPKALKLAPIFQQKSTGASTSKVIDVDGEPTRDAPKEKKRSFQIPLAKQVQPKSLDDFFGQTGVLGDKTVLRSMLERGEIPNMILWGPPGCGKTSLAGVIQEICKKYPKKLRFKSASAADEGIKIVRTVITQAKNDLKFGAQTILFMDEIHRFNKKQQDSFLMSVEKGEIILIGATTENPSFHINNALMSRCRIIVMEKLTSDDLFAILVRASESMQVDVVDQDNPCGVLEDNESLAIQEDALKWLADISDGDARIALGNLQMALQHCNEKGKLIKVDDIKEGIKKSHMLYDRNGEEHYNIISALHKSIRGSDANAALYWTTRMIVSGEDPMFIARRLVRAASEDIGNADPQALQLAVSTMQGCHLLGMPESDCLLAQCAIYLARANKSREADSALGIAKRMIQQHKGTQPAVPMHLRNSPTTLMKDLGYGKLSPGTEFTFMPLELKDVDFFH